MSALKSLLHPTWDNFRRAYNRAIWRISNRHNDTELISLTDKSKISVGNHSYGDLHIVQFGNTSRLTIGNYVSIGQDVVFILDADHFTDHVSTFPFKVKTIGEDNEATGKGNIIVHDDVWIGFGSTILSGIEIGQGAVIGARSVVTKNVPQYAIVAGNPAKIIRYRFKDEIISELKSLDFGQLDDTSVKNNIASLYERINTTSDVNKLNWFPRK